MSFPIFINELSYIEHDQEGIDAAELGSTFLGVLASIRRIRRDVVVHSERPLSQTPIGSAKSLLDLYKGDNFKEEWRLLRGLENRAPFEQSSLFSETDYTFNRYSAKGLGLAQSINTIALSLSHSYWNAEYLDLQKDTLCENKEGLIEQNSEFVSVRHVCCNDHATIHADWCIKYSENILTGDDLWDQRAEIFPKLIFLDRTETQIRRLKLGTQALKEVKARLFELNKSFANWVPASGDLPEFESYVTPEHSTRRRLCWFNDPNGQSKLFDWHARFTPGCGRIHFLMDHANSQAMIAHVGEKL